MRYLKMYLLVATLIATVAAGKPDLSAWFEKATAANHSGTAAATIEPDFMPGKTRHSMDCGGTGAAIGPGIWQLVKYDRAHGIGFAAATTDQCSASVFKAPPPGVSVPNADLSQLGTGRGIRIGSTYQTLVATYGGKPANKSGRLVVTYAAKVPGKRLTDNKPIVNDELLTFVIDSGRVSAITVSIDLGNEF